MIVMISIVMCNRRRYDKKRYWYT